MWKNEGRISAKAQECAQMVVKVRTYLVEAEYTLAMLCRTTGIDKARIMLVEPQEYQWIQVRM
jgi:hypothetical protein